VTTFGPKRKQRFDPNDKKVNNPWYTDECRRQRQVRLLTGLEGVIKMIKMKKMPSSLEPEWEMPKIIKEGVQRI